MSDCKTHNNSRERPACVGGDISRRSKERSARRSVTHLDQRFLTVFPLSFPLFRPSVTIAIVCETACRFSSVACYAVCSSNLVPFRTLQQIHLDLTFLTAPSAQDSHSTAGHFARIVNNCRSWPRPFARHFLSSRSTALSLPLFSAR